MRFLKRLAIVLVLLAVFAGIGLVYLYGGGRAYRDVSTTAAWPEEALEVALAFPEPLGNVATSADGRIFFTVHPEARTPGPKLYELVDGAARPWPDPGTSQNAFSTLLGLTIDGQNRLWLLEHGNHGLGDVRLTAYDLDTGVILNRYSFGQVAQWGSFFNDLAVSPDGNFVYITDASIFRKNPAIVVLDIKNNRQWRALQGQPSVQAQDLIIRNPARDMTYIFDLLTLKVGVDGLVLDAAGAYLYFAAVNNDGLYRIATDILNNPRAAPGEGIERIGTKPLSDGLSIDVQGNIYLTDVEHGGIARMAPDGTLETLINSSRVRWADGISYSSDGYFYFTDSAMPDMLLKSRSDILAAGPYYLFRFKADIPGIPGR